MREIGLPSRTLPWAVPELAGYIPTVYPHAITSPSKCEVKENRTHQTEQPSSAAPRSSYVAHGAILGAVDGVIMGALISLHLPITFPSLMVKMAPLIAAFLASYAAVFMFLLVCPVFSHIPAISFTRDKLLDIRKYTPPDISPDFVYSDVLLDIVVGGAAVLFRRYRTRRQGKRAGALVKLRRQGLRMLLPCIHLANLRSLPNKTDELLLLSRLNKDFSNSAALCFTETWLNGTIPDSALHLLNFQLIRADCDAESTGKFPELYEKRKATELKLKQSCHKQSFGLARQRSPTSVWPYTLLLRISNWKVAVCKWLFSWWIIQVRTLQ